MPDDTAVSCAKLAELIEMQFGLWTLMGPRKYVFIIIIILFVLNQTTQHMTANTNEQDQKAQRALKMALNA